MTQNQVADIITKILKLDVCLKILDMFGVCSESSIACDLMKLGFDLESCDLI